MQPPEVAPIREAGRGVWVQEEVGRNLAAAQSGHKKDCCDKEISLEREVGALNSLFRNVGFLLASVSENNSFELVLDHI